MGPLGFLTATCEGGGGRCSNHQALVRHTKVLADEATRQRYLHHMRGRPAAWYTLEFQICSWSMALLDRSSLSQHLARLSPPAPPAPAGCANRATVNVLLVKRLKGARSISNFDALQRALQESVAAALGSPACARLSTFEGEHTSFLATERQWRSADVVVAAHGAACAWSLFMTEGAALVELGYAGPKGELDGPGIGMPFPVNFYLTRSLASGVRHYISMAVGSYSGPMRVDTEDVRKLLTARVLPEQSGRLNDKGVRATKQRTHIRGTLPGVPPKNSGRHAALPSAR